MRNVYWLWLLALFTMSIQIGADSLEDGSEAARRFLKMWLVDQNIEGALAQVSKRRLICTPTMDSAEVNLRSHDEAVKTLKSVMEIVNWTLGKKERLADAIKPFRKEIGRRMNPLDQTAEFTVIDGSSSYARGAMCGENLASFTEPVVIVAFLFKVAEEEMEGMYFVFQNEGNKWALISFDRLKQ